MKLPEYLTVSTESEKEMEDVIALCELHDLKPYSTDKYPYDICSYVSIYRDRTTYQLSPCDTSIEHWRITAKEFISKYL